MLFLKKKKKKNENAPTNKSLHRPPFPKKIGSLTPYSYYVAITVLCTICAFDVFWLNRDKRIAMMVRAFQALLCVNKFIDMGRYTAQLLLHLTQCVNFVCLLS